MVEDSHEAQLVKKLSDLDMSFEIKAPTTEEPSPDFTLDPAKWAQMIRFLEHAEVTKSLVTKL